MEKKVGRAAVLEGASAGEGVSAVTMSEGASVVLSRVGAGGDAEAESSGEGAEALEEESEDGAELLSSLSLSLSLFFDDLGEEAGLLLLSSLALEDGEDLGELEEEEEDLGDGDELSLPLSLPLSLLESGELAEDLGDLDELSLSLPLLGAGADDDLSLSDDLPSSDDLGDGADGLGADDDLSLSLSDDDLSLSDDDLSLSDDDDGASDELSLSDDELSLSDDDLSLSDDEDELSESFLSSFLGDSDGEGLLLESAAIATPTMATKIRAMRINSRRAIFLLALLLPYVFVANLGFDVAYNLLR